VIKFIAFAITGSASMLAEGVHSVVDSGNQGLLLLGGAVPGAAPPPSNPFGYGRDRYVYGFLVALMLFSAGGLFALYEGVDKIRHPHHLDSRRSPSSCSASRSRSRATRYHRHRRVTAHQGRPELVRVHSGGRRCPSCPSCCSRTWRRSSAWCSRSAG